MFLALVHDVPFFSPMLKLNYLAGSLEGEAKGYLPSPPLTSDKYDGAWKALTDKYDSKKYLLSTYINNIISCPKVKKRTLAELTRVLENMRTSKQSIDNLQIPSERIGELWLIHHVSHKLDFRTLWDWETEADKSDDHPTYEQFLKFIERQIRVYDATQGTFEQPEESTKSEPKHMPSSSKQKTVSSYQAQTTGSCMMCKGDHYMHACSKFKELSTPQRLDITKKNRLCLNCLRKGHFLANCTSSKRCFVCKGKHHTHLHRDMPGNQESYEKEKESKEQIKVETNSYLASHGTSNPNSSRSVLLGTALIQLQDSQGNTTTARALIDPGSEKSFISEKILSSLQPKVRKLKVEVTGVGAAVTSVAHKEVSLYLKSNVSKRFSSPLSVYVLDKLTQLLPK